MLPWCGWFALLLSRSCCHAESTFEPCWWSVVRVPTLVPGQFSQRVFVVSHVSRSVQGILPSMQYSSPRSIRCFMTETGNRRSISGPEPATTVRALLLVSTSLLFSLLLLASSSDYLHFPVANLASDVQLGSAGNSVHLLTYCKRSCNTSLRLI